MLSECQKLVDDRWHVSTALEERVSFVGGDGVGAMPDQLGDGSNHVAHCVQRERLRSQPFLPIGKTRARNTVRQTNKKLASA